MAEGSRTYWLNLFSPETWQQFLDAGATVTGFRSHRWSQVQKIAEGDYLLCYLTRLSRFIGVLEVVGEPYQDTSGSIWDDDFPCRVRVRLVAQLALDTAVPITELRDSLSFFQSLKSPNAWSGQVRGSPTRWRSADGRAVVEAILHAERNPLSRPPDPRKLKPLPKSVPTSHGPVTVPVDDEPNFRRRILRQRWTSSRRRPPIPRFNGCCSSWGATSGSMCGSPGTTVADPRTGSGSPISPACGRSCPGSSTRQPRAPSS